MADYAARWERNEKRIRRTLVTPEGIGLNLRLADAGQRISAFFLDLVLMILILVGGSLIVAFTANAFGSRAIHAAEVIWLLGFFLLRNGYFIIMESGARAATFGKRICGLRVVARNGGRLTSDAVIARNLMREIEFYLPLTFLAVNAAEGSGARWMAIAGFGWTCIFLFFPLFNRDRLRIGDLLAGTWVIRTPKRGLGLDLARERPSQGTYGFTIEQLDAYGAFELQTLETVLRNGTPDARDSVAATIRNKIGSPPFETNDEFLNAYYVALRAHLERKLLFGRRRRDKFDRP